MNQNEKFARVKVRNQLLPLMQSFNNKIVEALARTANLLREDAGALTAQAENLIEHAMRPVTGKLDKTDEPSLDVHILAGAPAAVRRRALRQWILRERGDLRRLEMVHLLAVDKLLLGNRGGRVVELPDGARVTRRKGRLTVNGRRPEEKG